jgi:MoxR-like ATPase
MLSTAEQSNIQTLEHSNNKILNLLRPHAEDTFAEELAELKKVDDKPRPENWEISPWAVVEYLLGGKLENGFEIEPKYFGNRRLMEVAVATLATDRALLLIGIPGTGKTWVSEHLAAAVSGKSTLLVQGTAGMNEDAMRYGWNYAKLLAEGPSAGAMVASPLMNAMENGKIARIEELTRIPSDVQDTLITILSEKVLPVPELNMEIQARKGFNVIATANDRDKGVNDLSSALKRRFNTVVLPLPATMEEEVKIVKTRVDKIGISLALPAEAAPIQEIQRLVTIFRELRSGKTADGRTKLKIPTATLSTAEAISVINSGQALAAHFGDGTLRAADLAAGITGAIVKDPTQDGVAWLEYLETVVKERNGWKDLYRSCREML